MWYHSHLIKFSWLIGMGEARVPYGQNCGLPVWGKHASHMGKTAGCPHRFMAVSRMGKSADLPASFHTRFPYGQQPEGIMST
jgi:hypothetical protein